MESSKELDVAKLDVMEDTILHYDPSLLQILLQDKTTKRNIIWATKDYEELGEAYREFEEIKPELITGEQTLLIQPRSSKAKHEQQSRTRDKAEVFTPSWVCNCQNNLIDEEWFGRKDIFNSEKHEGWITNKGIIEFTNSKKTWTKYIDTQRLEISCGEAPYLVSRYDTVNGDFIPVEDRIGLLDRKLRIVSENTDSEISWIQWSLRALQSIYGFEYQGDNLLLARENILFSYIDYYTHYFKHNPGTKLIKQAANIISWNLWQMDGLKYVIPNSCHNIAEEQSDLLGNLIKSDPCPGCKYNRPLSHNGIYSMIKDWRSKTTVRFIDMMKGWN